MDLLCFTKPEKIFAMKKHFLLPAALLSVLCSAQNVTKKVLLEEFTTTLCGNCPPASHDVDTWYENNNPHAVIMTHHAGFGVDNMTNNFATTICNTFTPSTFGFCPAIMIDRDVYPWRDSVPYMPVGGFDSIAQRVSGNTAPVGITIQGTYDPNTRLLNVTVTATFVQNITPGPLRLNLYVVEDSIVGTGSGWDQKCYSSTFANQYYPGQYDATNHLILGYPHRYVERQSLSGGTWGSSGVIPNSPALNTPYSITASYTVPPGYNDARLSLVAYVANYGPTKLDRNVLNAADAKVVPVISSSVKDENSYGSQINSIYPNPSQGHLILDFTMMSEGNTCIRVSDILGRNIYTLEQGAQLSKGRYEKEFDLDQLQPGVYFITLQNEKETITRRFIIEK